MVGVRQYRRIHTWRKGIGTIITAGAENIVRQKSCVSEPNGRLHLNIMEEQQEPDETDTLQANMLFEVTRDQGGRARTDIIADADTPWRKVRWHSPFLCYNKAQNREWQFMNQVIQTVWAEY